MHGRRAALGGYPAWTRPPRSGWLLLLLVGLVILSLAWGVLAALTADQHASAAADVVAVSEPLSLDAEQIYQSLSDADATAATAFLSGGLEPAADRQRYDADITQAAIRIEAASALWVDPPPGPSRPATAASRRRRLDRRTGDDRATLSAGLPVYADEVGTARADNRLGYPLGAAYLREASTWLRGTLLPAAGDIYTKENGLLTSASAQATGLPLIVITVVIGLGLGLLLYRSSRWLTRRTHRRVNYGLLVAAVAFAVSLVWLAGAFAFGRAELLHAQQQGSVPAEAFARADVAALQAHADESLTLIDNSGIYSYQQDFIAQQKLLGPGPGTLLAAVQASAGNGSAAADAQAWYRGARGAARPGRQREPHCGGAVGPERPGGRQIHPAVRRPQRRDQRAPGRLRVRCARRPGRLHRAGRGHDRSVTDHGGRLCLGTEPPACGVPVKARPRPWLRVLIPVLAAAALALGAVAATAAPGLLVARRAPRAASAVGHARVAAHVTRRRAACVRPARRR